MSEEPLEVKPTVGKEDAQASSLPLAAGTGPEEATAAGGEDFPSADANLAAPLEPDPDAEGIYTPEDGAPEAAAPDEGPRPTKHPTLDLDLLPTDEGYLDDEPEAPATSAPPAEGLTVGGLSLTAAGWDRSGRQLATAPDGQTLVVATYRQAVEALLGLYPHPLLPPLTAHEVTAEGHLRAAHPLPGGTTLADALEAGDERAAVRAAMDLARFNRYLAARRTALVGLEPRDVQLEPTRFTRLPALRPLGDAGPEAPRYGAPERAAGLPVSGEEGAYVIGAVLYHALSGRALAEGETPAALPDRPGGPQVLGQLLVQPGQRPPASEVGEIVSVLERATRPRRSLVVGAASSVGLNPDRTANEDSCGWRLWEAVTDAGVEARLVACVSDGMGGMAKGEVASQAAVQSFLADPAPGPDPEALAARVVQANARVIEELESTGAGGCTFTGLALEGSRAALAHVGDTRAYLVRDGEATQVTEDHSVVAMLVRMGMLKPEEAHGHPDSNKVTRGLGSVRELPREHVFTATLELRDGDRVVLLSDGVWGPPEPAVLADLLNEAAPAQALADSLVSLALQNGAPDNATALVIDIRDLPAL